jgi:hypothetical protein
VVKDALGFQGAHGLYFGKNALLITGHYCRNKAPWP